MLLIYSISCLCLQDYKIISVDYPVATPSKSIYYFTPTKQENSSTTQLYIESENSLAKTIPGHNDETRKQGNGDAVKRLFT